VSDNQDLYTDYALQMFSTYVSQDLNSMHLVLESFKNDKKNTDALFLPGIIYGLLYHMANVFDVAASALDLDVESLLRQYAFDYAIERENLLENPLLNVHKAREMLDKILEEIKSIEDSWNSEEL
jgi:hypothetical protein